jgi:hypothetical protein
MMVCNELRRLSFIEGFNAAWSNANRQSSHPFSVTVTINDLVG